MKRIILLFFWGITLTCAAQDSLTPHIQVLSIDEKIEIDGQLNEELWNRTQSTGNFWQYFPNDDVKAEGGSEIFLAANDQFLYVGIRCYAKDSKFIVNSLQRDYRAGGTDNMTLLFDTFDDRTNAFMFGINPLGVRREGLIADGGGDNGNFSTSWDNKWFGEAHIYPDRWEAEMAIPFKTLRFKEGSRKWGLLAYRFDTQHNERSTWTRIPRNQSIFNLAYCGEVHWVKPPPKPGANIALIPYVSAGTSQDFEGGEDAPSRFYNFGTDAKIGIGPSLNLDLTINPDFSQVEVDRQVTNLSRFEIFFPERRQFFLENADLFSNFGTNGARPFFSRRIGIAKDSATGENIQNPIWLGARLSGKINETLRVGLLNMTTAPDPQNAVPGFNYTVAALQQRVFRRSNLAFIMVNKSGITDSTGELGVGAINPNRTLGADFNLASANGRWAGKIFYHHNFSDTTSAQAFSQGTQISYIAQNLRVNWDQQWVGEDFDAVVGFVRRRNFFSIRPGIDWNFFPKSGSINRHGPRVNFRSVWTPEDGQTDYRLQFSYRLSFLNNSNLNFNVVRDYTYLFSDFDPSGTGGLPLLEGTDYAYNSIRLSYRSDRRRKLNGRIEVFGGEYFNGSRWGIESNLNLRLQPYFNMALTANYNNIQLPAPYSTANLFLIGPRIDLTFSRKIFLTTFLQYNNQTENVNLNTRFQWRFAPVSDLFIVYTDNYMSSDFRVKNRALTLKLTYWLSV
ncbi:MAG: DUF5916 domain-containing protein [Bacteroidota bacterium]